MTFNFRGEPSEYVAALQSKDKRVFVDGVEVQQVWYFDDENGIVKTYDVAGDGKPHHASENASLLDFFNTETLDNGVYSRTLRGKVELR